MVAGAFRRTGARARAKRSAWSRLTRSGLKPKSCVGGPIRRRRPAPAAFYQGAAAGGQRFGAVGQEDAVGADGGSLGEQQVEQRADDGGILAAEEARVGEEEDEVLGVFGRGVAGGAVEGALLQAGE
jgi:hypothetical protein